MDYNYELLFNKNKSKCSYGEVFCNEIFMKLFKCQRIMISRFSAYDKL